MCLRHPNALKFVQPWGTRSQKPKSLRTFSCCQGALDLTYTHFFAHELTKRSHTASSCCGLLRFCLVWTNYSSCSGSPGTAEHPCSWLRAGSCQTSQPGRAGKALVWSSEAEPSWPTLPAKWSPNISPRKVTDSSGQPGMTNYPLQNSIRLCLQLHPAWSRVKPLASNGASSIMVSRLCRLNATVRLPILQPNPDVSPGPKPQLCGWGCSRREGHGADGGHWWCCELKATAQISLGSETVP